MQDSPCRFCVLSRVLDQRAVLLGLMGLTKIASNWICNSWLFSMQPTPSTSSDLSCLAPRLQFHWWTACPFAPSLPRHSTGCCHSTRSRRSCVWAHLCFCMRWSNHTSFPWMSTPNTASYWLMMVKINWNVLPCIALSVVAYALRVPVWLLCTFDFCAIFLVSCLIKLATTMAA